jgi:hypothetical protein
VRQSSRRSRGARRTTELATRCESVGAIEMSHLNMIAAAWLASWGSWGPRSPRRSKDLPPVPGAASSRSRELRLELRDRRLHVLDRLLFLVVQGLHAEEAIGEVRRQVWLLERELRERPVHLLARRVQLVNELPAPADVAVLAVLLRGDLLEGRRAGRGLFRSGTDGARPARPCSAGGRTSSPAAARSAAGTTTRSERPSQEQT